MFSPSLSTLKDEKEANNCSAIACVLLVLDLMRASCLLLCPFFLLSARFSFCAEYARRLFVLPPSQEDVTPTGPNLKFKKIVLTNQSLHSIQFAQSPHCKGVVFDPNPQRTNNTEPRIAPKELSCLVGLLISWFFCRFSWLVFVFFYFAYLSFSDHVAVWLFFLIFVGLILLSFGTNGNFLQKLCFCPFFGLRAGFQGGGLLFLPCSGDTPSPSPLSSPS